jgi:hypothetical protein
MKFIVKKSILRFTKSIERHNLLAQFKKEYKMFSQLARSNNRFELRWENRWPITTEKTATTHFDSHYIFHPAWAARILAQIQPSIHVDIASNLHFCTMISAFIPVHFYDYRPFEVSLSGLQSKRDDLSRLSFADNSIESLSCMHVVEHIGLGRYGDPIDPDGDLKAISELKRVLSRGGSLLFVVPVGQPEIRFNAHRIYSYEQIGSYFAEFQVKQFALVTDKGAFLVNASPEIVRQQSYGCGCWWFKKPEK